MVTRYIPIVDDNFTGKEIPAGKVKPVKIEIDGEMRELDMTLGSAHFGSLKAFWDKGILVGDEDNVRPIKSAKSATKPVKATKATAAAKSTKNVTVTTVESQARVWAQDNGASGLPPRLPREVTQAFKDKNPDMIPAKFIKPVVQGPAPAKANGSVSLDMTEGTRTRVKKAATKAPAFKEAKAG